MITRYRMYRGRRPDCDPLPDGLRQDTRKHTRHCLRPEADTVASYLANPTQTNWRRFATAYRATIKRRIAADPTPFDSIAAAARQGDVHLGCSCPSRANPDVRRCHTWLALELLQSRYPDLEVVFPPHASDD